jgi:hypothetical protein
MKVSDTENDDLMDPKSPMSQPDEPAMLYGSIFSDS